MARRADPQHIYQAGRAALRDRLLSTGMDPETAKVWLTKWELAAATRAISTTGDFWTAGDAWIAEERAAKHRPTN